MPPPTLWFGRTLSDTNPTLQSCRVQREYRGGAFDLLSLLSFQGTRHIDIIGSSLMFSFLNWILQTGLAIAMSILVWCMFRILSAFALSKLLHDYPLFITV